MYHIEFRPQELSEVVGNKPIKTMLSRFVQDIDKMPKVFLFHGPHGCGKTTFARILTKELGIDLDDPINYIEQNASNANGKDDAANAIEAMQYLPTNEVKRRAFVFDESHRLTKNAQDALLKVCEDTPEGCYIFLCTTDPQKILPQLRSRCTKVPVQLFSASESAKFVKWVVNKHKLDVCEDVQSMVVASTEGSPRTLLVAFEAVEGATVGDAKVLLKDCSQEKESKLCNLLLNSGSWGDILKEVNSTTDFETARRGILGYLGVVMSKSPSKAEQCYRIMICFMEPYYDTGKAKLLCSCYEAMEGE